MNGLLAVVINEEETFQTWTESFQKHSSDVNTSEMNAYPLCFNLDLISLFSSTTRSSSHLKLVWTLEWSHSLGKIDWKK